MTETEKRLSSRRNDIESLLREDFQSIVMGATWFIHPDGTYFRVSCMGAEPPWDALVIEYAQNKTDAKQNMTEDGDLFYPSEFNSIKQMNDKMLTEINN